MPSMDRFQRFDASYYQRFYLDPKTRVMSEDDHGRLAEFIFAFAEWNHV